jgi:hypothetical protein
MQFKNSSIACVITLIQCKTTAFKFFCFVSELNKSLLIPTRRVTVTRDKLAVLKTDYFSGQISCTVL